MDWLIMRREMRAARVWVMVAAGFLGVAVPEARAGDDEPKTVTTHQLAQASSLPKAHKDFSRFLYRPAGDKVVEQADANRLLFRTRDGVPDGYAERRGNAVVYYDRAGHATRVQPLPEDAVSSPVP